MSRFKTDQIFVTVTKVRPTPDAPNPAYWKAEINISDSLQEFLEGIGIVFDFAGAPSGNSSLSKEEALRDLITQLVGEFVSKCRINSLKRDKQK